MIKDWMNVYTLRRFSLLVAIRLHPLLVSLWCRIAGVPTSDLRLKAVHVRKSPSSVGLHLPTRNLRLVRGAEGRESGVHRSAREAPPRWVGP